MSQDIHTNDSAAHAPEEVRKWAQRITEVQGCPTVLAREVSGYHLYIPCPLCLEDHGRRELDDPKYAINLSVLAGLGDYRDTTEGQAWRPGMFEEREELRKKQEFGAGICMRTRSSRKPHIIPLEKLLNMGTVTQRFPDIETRADVRGGAGTDDIKAMWEEDPVSGQMAPPPAGELVALDTLPVEHPAVQYLLRRNYKIDAIMQQFSAAYCTKEYPYGEKQIFYRKMPGGWKDSPQHRVVFKSMVDGVPLSWQARVIEKESEDGLNRYMLHPYGGGFFSGFDTLKIMRAHKAAFKSGGEGDIRQLVRDANRGGYWLHVWSHTHTRANPKAAWQPMSPYDEMKDGALKFRPSKYRTAKYSQRQLMGWDAAIERADKDDTKELRWAVLCEGPLDGARIGPGGLPVTGSSISMENAAKVVKHFHLVFLAFDDDTAGREATEKIGKLLQSPLHKEQIMLALVKLELPAGRDPGDLSPDEYQRIFQRAFTRVKRSI